MCPTLKAGISCSCAVQTATEYISYGPPFIRLNVALNSTREGVQQIANQMTSEVPKEIEGMTGLGVEVRLIRSTRHLILDILTAELAHSILQILTDIM